MSVPEFDIQMPALDTTHLLRGVRASVSDTKGSIALWCCLLGQSMGHVVLSPFFLLLLDDRA